MKVPILESVAFQGEELIIYLQSTYLPAQNVEPELAQQFCRALKSDPKVFRNYFKVSVAPNLAMSSDDRFFRQAQVTISKSKLFR